MVDCAYRLRASSFMELAQMAAMKGSESLGFGYDVLKPVSEFLSKTQGSSLTALVPELCQPGRF